MTVPRLATIALSVLLLAVPMYVSPAAAANWPGLRGPSHDGAVHDARLFPGEAGELQVTWKTELGSGYSVVAADGERVVTAFQQGDSDYVAAFDPGSGAELWRHRIGDAYKGHSGSHDGPIATPVLDGDRVYGLGPRGDLYALSSATGDAVWTKSLVDDFGAEPPFYGFASSPVVTEGVLIVAAGAGEGRAVLGLDAATGEERWAAGTDSIRYQSPVLARIGGRLQAVVAGNQTVQGLDPATGEILWHHEHLGDPRDMGGNTIVPLPAGEGRILLLNRHPTSVMLKVTKTSSGDGGKGYEVSELWTASTIKSTYVVPVYHDGHIYGMNSKIFTCIDAETGEMKWRSREPGDGFPTLVGDHLVIMSKPGVLRVARASSEGYEQVAELALFDELSWSAPAFVDGRLYVRSMGHLARVDPALPHGGAKREASWIDATLLGRFLDRVEAADLADRGALIDAFLAEHESFPIVEPSGAVHFLYRGEAQDVGIVGDMIGFRREDPMHRVAGTDLFHYSVRLEPDAAVTYGFIPDFGDPVADPLNPRTAEGLFGEVSWLSMPAWRVPSYLGDGGAPHPGTLETVEWESEVQEGRTRKASVYLPAGYGDPQSSGERYPVVYVFGGDEALEKGRMKDALDHLTGDRMRPVVAVFVLPDPENPDRGPEGAQRVSQMVVEELVPLVDGKYRTVAEPMARAVAGAGGAGDAALATAFAHPDVFGRVGSVWPIVFAPLGEIPRAEERPLVIYHAWGTYHIRAPHEAWDQVEANRELWASLREAGHRPTGGEKPEGFGWVVWRAHTADMLGTLFPRNDLRSSGAVGAGAGR